jgi:hypothetical protein
MRRIALLFALVAVACGQSQPTPVEPPTPSPSPEPPAIVGCGLPPGGPFERCPYDLPLFNHEINAAIAEVENERPELFDFDDWQGGLSYRVLDRERYHAEVVTRLERMGFCAVWDGEEVGVKNDNGFNEQYQVMTSMGYVRWGAGAYRSTCFPSWF